MAYLQSLGLDMRNYDGGSRMSGAEISLVAVVAAFTGLVAWVYWPGNRGRLRILRHHAAGRRSRPSSHPPRQANPAQET